MADKSGYKHCTDPTHRKSAVNGRCLTCRNKAMKLWRESRRQASLKVTEIIEGNPCRNCGETTRYATSRSCVRCQREHGKRDRGAATVRYGVPQEFLCWVMSPIPELNSV